MSIYTYSEQTEKKYTFQDAINNAHNRVASINMITNSFIVRSNHPKIPLTLEEVNKFADLIVRGF